MPTCYFELRTQSARGTDSLTADMMRHFYARQHLGKTLVITDDPRSILSGARKQWLRISRTIQKQRASTLNADKILKYTHNISHMQQLRFTLKSPIEFSVGDVFFAGNNSMPVIPSQCFTVYLYSPLDAALSKDMVAQLPTNALVVDYHHDLPWETLGLAPKKALEAEVTKTWEEAVQFLTNRDIDVTTLQQNSLQTIEAMDDALDTLLSASYAFIQVATAFQRALELARPLRLSKELRQQYDVMSLLAHRVQALSPSAFTQQFLEVYNEDDALMLFDGSICGDISSRLANLILHHRRAGRHQLAQAFERYATATTIRLQ